LIAPFVKTPLVANKLVDVVLVPVALTQVKFVRSKVPTAKLVKAPLVEKRFVVVTDVPVAKLNNKLLVFKVAIVDEPVTTSEAPVAVVKVNPSIVPEVESKLVKFAIEPFTVSVFNVVIVPVTYDNIVPERVAMVPVVAVKFAANRFVLVVFVPVALVQTRFVKLEGAEPVTVRFTTVALVAKRLVVVALVDVVSVNTPVEGVMLPICVPLIEPPEIVALDDVRFGAFKVMMVPVSAFIVVPEAVAKPSQFVEVPSLKVKLEMVPLVVTKFVTNKFVPVPFVKLVSCKSVAPFTVKAPEIDWFVEETLVNVECPTTFKLPFDVRLVEAMILVEETAFVAVRSPCTRKLLVEVPPLNWMSCVVVLPAFVTIWKVETVPDGQFVPSNRQTGEPFTISELPEELLKLKVAVEVPFANTKSVTVS
jgi:hypothetical protein